MAIVLLSVCSCSMANFVGACTAALLELPGKCVPFNWHILAWLCAVLHEWRASWRAAGVTFGTVLTMYVCMCSIPHVWVASFTGTGYVGGSAVNFPGCVDQTLPLLYL